MSLVILGMFMFLCLSERLVCLSTKINIVSVTGQNPRFGLVPTGPAFDVALDHAKAVFPETLSNISRYEVYKPGIFACGEAGDEMQLVAAQVARLIETLDGFTILLCPGCSLEIMVLGDYARGLPLFSDILPSMVLILCFILLFKEWNVPLLASSASDGRLTNKVRYPTVTAYGPVDLASMALAANMLLARHQWKTVTLCCDSLVQYPTLNTVYVLLCQNIKTRLESQRGTYSVTTIQFSSVKNTYETMLTKIQTQSRMFVFTRPSIFRDILNLFDAVFLVFVPASLDWDWLFCKKIYLVCLLQAAVIPVLVIAHKMNMTNGDFVFIAPESTKQPTLGDVAWRGADGNDTPAFIGFQSAIIMSHPNVNWVTAVSVFDTIARLSRDKYNKTLTDDETYNDVVVCAYQAIGTLAVVLNDSYSRLGELNGRSFSRLLWNRTYDLDLQTIYVDPNGMKKGDVSFTRLNNFTGLFEEAWYYSTTMNLLTNTSRLSSVWYNRLEPPPDMPLCGFYGERCFATNSLATLLVAIVAPVAILLLLGITALIHWRRSQIKDRNSLWWRLDPSLLNSDSANVTLAIPATSGDVTRQDIQSKCGYKLKTYGNEVVWTEAIIPALANDAIAAPKILRKCFAAMKHLHHDNVGRFYGVVSTNSSTFILWEFGTHGSLRMLLDSNTTTLNADLLTSMIWDILEGMRYLHTTDLHCHGAVSSITSMIDKRFCLKMSGFGSTKILSALTKRNVSSDKDALKLWLPPEMLTDPSNPGARHSDIFSIALVILEIFTRCTPLDVILESESSVEHAIKHLLANGGARIAIADDVPHFLQHILAECLTVNPKLRPTLKVLSTKVGHFYPQKGFLAKLMSRMERYSEDLERMVAAQTQDLIEEQQKVDLLLKEMIPAAFIDKLRNKIPVPSESFDSVTVFFSDLPEFSRICSLCSPLQIILLLNTIYSKFDIILENYDVYKVETINDSYMVVSGLPKRNGSRHASEIAQMALTLVNTPLISPLNKEDILELRIGIHTGSCVAGIVGLRMPRYCLFGDTINTASRMESHGQASRIHISPTTKEVLSQNGGFVLQSRGLIQVKGKGDLETFWLLGMSNGPRPSLFPQGLSQG